MLALLQHALMRSVDGFYACIPRRQPSAEALKQCKVIAHRGAHDRGAVENTLAAFTQAEQAGCWGVEFDLRWSSDDVPIISHDAHAGRLFGDETPLSSLSAAAIRARLPQIPTLAEVLDQFAGRLHLMIELKEPLTSAQAACLEQLLAPLTACSDYHFLALRPELFDTLPSQDRTACLAVSEINAGHISREVARHGLGGHMGHFLLIHRRMRENHEMAGQRVGTGFISSRNTLFRELNSRTQWIFTNHPHRLQAILNRHRGAAGA